jgi:hypothetical protein
MAAIDRCKPFGGLEMRKILVGLAAATMWLALSQASNAERVCRQVCDHGACVSKCVDHPDSGVVVHERDHYRDVHPGPGVDVHGPGVDIDVGH